MSHGQGPDVSTLDDFMVAVQARFAAAGDPTPVLIGERWLPQFSAPPRIVFRPTKDGGNFGPPNRVGAGFIASIRETMTAYVWGDETVADGDRYRAAKALCMRLINAYRREGPGKLTGLNIARGDATAETFGEEYQVTAAFTWNVPQDAAIWAPPTTPEPNPDPMRPQGDTGETESLTMTTTGSR
jgi:hypothetical protein